MRQDQVPRHGPPGHADDEDGADIGKEGKGQPPQDRRVSGVSHEHLGSDGHDREGGDVEDDRAGDQQMERRRHRAEIGAEIDGVGDDQQADQGIEQP